MIESARSHSMRWRLLAEKVLHCGKIALCALELFATDDAKKQSSSRFASVLGKRGNAYVRSGSGINHLFANRLRYQSISGGHKCSTAENRRPRRGTYTVSLEREL